VCWVRDDRVRVALEIREVVLEGYYLLQVMKEFFRFMKEGRGF
jgi:hypothetical protein